MKTAKELGSLAIKNGRLFYLASLGTVAVVEGTTRDIFGNLVEKGRSTSEKKVGSDTKKPSLFDKLGEMGSRRVQQTADRIARVGSRFGVPSRKEILELTASVEKLTEKVQALQTTTAK